MSQPSHFLQKGSSDNPVPRILNKEGYNVVCALWLKFWQPNIGTFISPVKCSGVYDNGRFNLWSMSIAAQAIVDGARVYPTEFKYMIPGVMEALERYRSPQFKGYCAAENFNGNKDIYYDDDAQVASAIITAYEVSGYDLYLKRAIELVDFLLTGYNGVKGGVGGMHWHISKDYCNACTSAESALAALRVLKHSPDKARTYIPYIEKCLGFNISILLDKSDYLIRDGTGEKDFISINNMKWTYNLGTTLSGFSLLYKVSNNPRHREIADKLADAALDRSRALFDRDYYDYEKRYYHDPSYFIQLLFEGYADYLETFGDHVPSYNKRRIYNEVHRHLVLFYGYMRDDNDGLYWESFEIYRINRKVYKKYQKEFGGHKPYSPNGSEREDNGDRDIDKRPMAKSLIASGSAARIWFQAARIIPELGKEYSQTEDLDFVLI